MKKSNVILFALLAVASAFLLWLWFYLGLNRVDEPLDLVLSIVWWAVVVVAIVVIVKMEQTRRRRIRTVYVGDSATFNSENGLVRLVDDQPAQDAIATILENLKYDFSRADFPEKDEFEVKYFVRTKEYKVEKADESEAAESAEGVEPIEPIEAIEAVKPTVANQPSTEQQKKWKGEVFVVETKEEHPFETPEELAGILATLEQAA